MSEETVQRGLRDTLLVTLERGEVLEDGVGLSGPEGLVVAERVKESLLVTLEDTLALLEPLPSELIECVELVLTVTEGMEEVVRVLRDEAEEVGLRRRLIEGKLERETVGHEVELGDLSEEKEEQREREGEGDVLAVSRSESEGRGEREAL